MNVVPFFRTEARIQALQDEARRWPGTPYCSNSDAPGQRGGVSCHNLPRAVLVNAHCLPSSFPKVQQTLNATRHATESLIEPFMDARPEFMRINPLEEAVIVGDVLGFRVFKCLDHLGLCVGGDRSFLHVLDHKHACVDFLADPTWGSRLLAVWRPIELLPL